MLLPRSLLAAVLLCPALAAAQSTLAATPVSVRLQSFSVIVPDYDEAKAWYMEKLGFVVLRDQRFGQDERFIQVAPAADAPVSIVLQKARMAPSPSEPAMPTDYSDRIGKTTNIVLRVSDVTAYARTLEQRGVTLTAPPRQMPWGGQATFKDLYGNSFVIVGPLTAR
ncbi:MAG TPA: VOC family protein [Gemmatimonadaceae bacterium]|nr:VOC family protein [Gemmatimonadaceae bacterium]